MYARSLTQPSTTDPACRARSRCYRSATWRAGVATATAGAGGPQCGCSVLLSKHLSQKRSSGGGAAGGEDLERSELRARESQGCPGETTGRNTTQKALLVRPVAAPLETTARRPLKEQQRRAPLG